MPRSPRRPPLATTALGPVAGGLLFVAGALLCVLFGYAMGRASRPVVRCNSTLSVESVGPSEWTLSCESPR